MYEYFVKSNILNKFRAWLCLTMQCHFIIPKSSYGLIGSNIFSEVLTVDKMVMLNLSFFHAPKSSPQTDPRLS